MQEHPADPHREHEGTHHPGHVVAESGVNWLENEVFWRLLRHHGVAIRGVRCPESVYKADIDRAKQMD